MGDANRCNNALKYWIIEGELRQRSLVLGYDIGSALCVLGTNEECYESAGFEISDEVALGLIGWGISRAEVRKLPTGESAWRFGGDPTTPFIGGEDSEFFVVRDHHACIMQVSGNDENVGFNG